MKLTKLYLIVFLSTLLFQACDQSEDAEWVPKKAAIMTQWAETINPDAPWDLYPRPQMVRKNWKNLNGLWKYAITDAATERPDEMDGTILVPYPLESALSGVMLRIDKDSVLWYKRDLPHRIKLKSTRVLLHFEAVDWHTEVFIDDQFIGEHTGGYSPFSFDITEFLDNRKEQDLWIKVIDPSTQGYQPVGKQHSDPHGIWYTPTSGIWQSVWMENVPDSYIKDYHVTPDIDKQLARISVDVENADEDYQVEVIIKNGNTIVGSELKVPGKTFDISIINPVLWSPENPQLYDLEITLHHNSNPVDHVKGYFGMRKISLGKTEDGITRILLNNQFVFQIGPLDQGFWPDGLYTPPTEEAMVFDLKQLKEMGFNMLRKHVKVENRRFYYWTDQMGLLVWQDMPNGRNALPGEKIETGSEASLQFEKELKELILTHDNHPSIVMWVPFNEGWGQYDTERIVDYVKSLDSTRLVNNASGWTDKGVGDVLDVHHYPEPIAPPAEEDRAIVLGEFGGLGLPLKDHTWQQDLNWGYENMSGAESLLQKYEEFYQTIFDLTKDPGLSAVIYTQTTDVEIETNGLMTYDRAVNKMGAENVFKAHAGFVAPRLRNKIYQFIDIYTAELFTPATGAEIYYTIDGTDPSKTSNKYTGPFSIKQSTSIKAIAYWPGGQVSRIGVFEITKVNPQPATKANIQMGLNYSFYRGAWTTLPDFSKLTPGRSGINPKIDLAPGRNLESDFGLTFIGYLNVPATDVYVLTLSSDDGGRLFIDNTQVIDHDGIHGMGFKTVTLALEEGYHPIELKYFQHLGGRGLRLMWESALIKQEEIGAKFYGR